MKRLNFVSQTSPFFFHFPLYACNLLWADTKTLHARRIDESVLAIRAVIAPIPTYMYPLYLVLSVFTIKNLLSQSRNQTCVLTVTDSPRPIDSSVSDRRVEFGPVPTPSSHFSLSHPHRSMGFFHNPYLYPYGNRFSETY